MKNEYQEMEVIEKYLRDGRWYVRLKNFDTTKTIPNANYVWLVGNPSFKEIPIGYVVHHLDFDSVNDDISNLVIMAKYHHVAYHWKHKNVETTIITDPTIDEIVPTVTPRVYFHIKRNRYRIYYRVREDGKAKGKYLNSYDGKPFKTQEDALSVCHKLWPKMFQLSHGSHTDETVGFGPNNTNNLGGK